jgi:hypothetical protein
MRDRDSGWAITQWQGGDLPVQNGAAVAHTGLVRVS